MEYFTPKTTSLQSLLFLCDDFSSYFFRKPTARELEFLAFYSAVQQLLSFEALTAKCDGPSKLWAKEADRLWQKSHRKAEVS